MGLLLPWASAQSPRPAQTSGGGERPFTVAILPVKIHSPENLAYMQEGLLDMLISRVELPGRVSVLEKGAVKKALSQVPGEVDAESARRLGEALGADYVVFGSLTKLGDSSSLDLKVVAAKGEKPASSVYVQARKMEEVIHQVDELARKIDEKILGVPLGPPAAEKPAVAERPAQVPGQVAAIPTPPPGLRPLMPARPERGALAAGFYQSTPLPFKAVGMAMGDLDGDGRNEIVLIDNQNLWIYRWENEFKLLKRISGKKTEQFLAVDVGDIRKDGKAQIFVSCLEGDESESSPRRLDSFAVAFQEGDYRVVARNLEWFLRVVNWGDRGPVLLGQKRGYKIGFEGAIFEMGWDGKGYKEVRKVEASKVPSLYGFTPFFHGGNTYFAFVDSDFRLKVLDQKGTLVWRSSATYGSDVSFRVKPIPGGFSHYEGDDLAFVNIRVIARGDEVLILRNLSPVGQLFKRQKYFSGGEVQSLVWSGAMLMETWRSQEISGYLADFQIQDFDGAPGAELVVAVNLPREAILSGETTSALMISRVQ